MVSYFILGEMSMEDLINKYGGAYDSDFEMPENDSESDCDTEDETDDGKFRFLFWTS